MVMRRLEYQPGHIYVDDVGEGNVSQNLSMKWVGCSAFPAVCRTISSLGLVGPVPDRVRRFTSRITT